MWVRKMKSLLLASAISLLAIPAMATNVLCANDPTCAASGGTVTIGSGTGTITGVTAGTNMTGGGTSGNVTLNATGSISGVTASTGLSGGGTSGTVSLSVTNPMGATTVAGGYTYYSMPGGYYHIFGGLNSSTSGATVVTLPITLSTGVLASGASTNTQNYNVTASGCNGPPVTQCNFTVTTLANVPTSGIGVYFWIDGH